MSLELLARGYRWDGMHEYYGDEMLTTERISYILRTIPLLQKTARDYWKQSWSMAANSAMASFYQDQASAYYAAARRGLWELKGWAWDSD